MYIFFLVITEEYFVFTFLIPFDRLRLFSNLPVTQILID